MPQSLVLIDSDKIRSAHLKKCKDAKKQLEKNQKILADHRDIDTPAFISWMSAEFGDLISSVRALAEQHSYFEQLFYEVESLSYRRHVSMRHAYEIVMEARENQKKHESLFDDDEQDDEFDDNEFENFEFDRSEFERNRKEYFDTLDQLKKNAGQASTPEQNELKSLFRDFAKRLHPDVNKNLSPQDKDLWHSVLIAYEQRDLTKLQALHAFNCDKDQTSSGSLGIGELQKIYRQIMKSVRAVQKEIKSQKDSPYWNFKERLRTNKGMASFKMQTRAELMRDKFELEMRVRDFELQVERCKKPSKPRRGPTPGEPKPAKKTKKQQPQKTAARLHKF